MNEALAAGDHVGALTVIEIAKQKAEENPLAPEEIERIKAARAADGERVKLCMPIKEALKTLAEYPLSPEEAATRPGLFKGTEYVVEERLDRAFDWLSRFYKSWKNIRCKPTP